MNNNENLIQKPILPFDTRWSRLGQKAFQAPVRGRFMVFARQIVKCGPIKSLPSGKHITLLTRWRGPGAEDTNTLRNQFCPLSWSNSFQSAATPGHPHVSFIWGGGLHSDCLLRLKCIFTILPACCSEPRCTRGELHSVFSPSNEAWNISKEEDGRRWKWEGFNSLLLPFRCKNSDNSALFHRGPKFIFWDSWIVVELKR